MAKKLTLGYSDLTDSVFVGKLNKSEEYFLDGKQDITNNFIGVMLQYVGVDQSRQISSSSNKIIVAHSEVTKESLDKMIKHLTDLKESLWQRN